MISSRPARHPGLSLTLLESALAAGALATAAYLRFANLPGNPGWYSDEGTLLNITRHLLEGRIQYEAVTGSTLIAARLPAFPLILGWLFGGGGVDISELRLLTACLGVLSTGLLYALVRVMVGPEKRLLAVLAAWVMAIYPNGVIYSRLGFSYNLLTPLLLAAALLVWRYLERVDGRDLLVASLLVGLGAVSDLAFLSVGPALILVASLRNWRHLPLVIIALSLPWLIYTGIMLSLAREAFLFDLEFTVSRLGQIPLIAQFPLSIYNWGTLFRWDPWFGPGLVGLLVLEPVRARKLALLFFLIPLFSLGRSTSGLAGLGFHYLIPLLPWVALGVASLLWKGGAWVLAVVHDAVGSLFRAWGLEASRGRMAWGLARGRRLLEALVLFVLLPAPLLISAFETTSQVALGFQTAIQGVLVDAADARRVAGFLKSTSLPGDLVVGSPAVLWQLDNRVADFQQMLAADGRASLHYPLDLPKERFAYDARLGAARFAVLDPIWRDWAVPTLPELADLMPVIERWPVVFRAGAIEVRENAEPETP